MQIFLMLLVLLIAQNSFVFAEKSISILDDTLLVKAAPKEKAVSVVKQGDDVKGDKETVTTRQSNSNPTNLNQKSGISKLDEQKEAVGDELKQMREYQLMLSQRQKDVDMLNLDLKKAQLVLERKEVESKIQEVDRKLQSPSGKADTVIATEEKWLTNQTVFSDIQVSLILVSENINKAILVRKGVSYAVREGDCILQNILVKTITPQEVVLSCEGMSDVRLTFAL